ncbi:MAG: gamma-glutamyl-gamma-aminobutyrate hydrolase family protein [Clostridia bacterium]|nr:gamma-glutamyl-gamma-aminobutyrate hydrolase family protein [Clostridia bacterium]
MPTSPLIGITPQYDASAKQVWIRKVYVDAVIRAGGIPVMLDQYTDRDTVAKLCTRLDGILFSGGCDLHPNLYGEEVLPECDTIAPERDAFEALLFSEVERAELPVLGICRGIQSLNVFAGGSLYQDIPGHRDVRHPVRIEAGTHLHTILGKTEISANSYHHQAVKVPAPGFVVSAYAADGTMEAVERPGERFFVGVQWHPELLVDEEDHARIFRAFVSACSDG